VALSEQWPDIPGITASGGQPRLPAKPDVVVKTLTTALLGIGNGGITRTVLVDRVHAATGESRQRLEGLAGWLPLSRVASWNEDTGQLELHPSTDLGDLAMRYAAWVGSQPIPADQMGPLEDYVRTIVEEAMAAARTTPRPPQTASMSHQAEAAPQAARAVEEPLVPAAISRKLRVIVDGLDTTFLERRLHNRASLLALLSGNHVLLLGPPGTAKSMLARALCGCFREANYFEYLLSRFTHPDELFGPVSIPGLKDEDYRRLTQGFLPQAHVAFLDEIFKANSAILNSLLTLINERVFHHGRHRDPVPLIGLIGASNELPDPEGGLEALFDRFLVRLAVPPLADARSFLSVATGRVSPLLLDPEDQLTTGDLAVVRAAAERVVVPPRVEDALVGLWRIGGRQDWETSDRRWRQAVDMIKVGVAAEGRRTVELLDLLLLQPVLAPTPDRIPEVRDAILDRLGSGAVPQHDLRAQWLLLRSDKVAPVPGEPLPPPPPHQSHWPQRIGRRRGNVDRFLQHHADAVQRLGRDRSDLEAQADRHVWIDALPVQVLSAHIEAARDLARILEIAEGYRDQLQTSGTVARALVMALPERSRRVYGHDLACTLSIPEAQVRVGLTLAGERVPAEEGSDRRRTTGDLSGENVIVELKPDQLLNWLANAVETSTLLTHTPAWAARNAKTALESARRLIGGQLAPPPPELPRP